MNARYVVEHRFHNKSKSKKPKLSLFAIYPDFWSENWGNPPLLGFVYAENDFQAIRKAELNEVYRPNVSFGIKAVPVPDMKTRLKRSDLYPMD